MFTIVQPKYIRVGYLPEFRCYLLRSTETSDLELWTPSRGVSLDTILFGETELEFVRDVQNAYRAVDDDFNRKHHLNEIGRIYVDTAPSEVSVKIL